MAMIEKGIVLEEPERKVNKFNALRNGFADDRVGFWVLLVVYIWMIRCRMTGAGFSVVIFTVLGGGIAYLAYFFIVLKMLEKEKEQ